MSRTVSRKMKSARAIAGALVIAAALATTTAAGAMTVSSQGYGHGQSYGGSDGERYSAHQWPGLSDSEIAALRAWLGPRAPVSIVLVYRPSSCAALEQSLGRLFDGLHWPRADAQGPLLDENPDGITLLPDNPDTRDLKDALQAATPLHVEIRDAAPASLGAGEIILVIGEKPREASGRIVKSFDGDCQ